MPWRHRCQCRPLELQALSAQVLYEETFLETNIFGINKNLYKKKIKVYFLKFLRGDKKFKNSNQLIKQMNKDVISSKKGLKIKLVT